MVDPRLKAIWDILYELRRHKTGLIGFIILIAEVLSIPLFPLIASADAIDHWDDFDYWQEQMTPRLAPPIWVSYLVPTAPPPTHDLQPQVIKEVYDFRKFSDFKEFWFKLHGDEIYTNPILRNLSRWGGLDQLIREQWLSEKIRVGKVVFIRIIYFYKQDRPAPPIDVLFRLKLMIDPALYSKLADPMYREGFGIYIVRPDNITISLIPGTHYPDNLYDINQYADIRDTQLLSMLGIPFTMETGTGNKSKIKLCPGDSYWSFSFMKLQQRLQSYGLGTGLIEILRPLIEESGENLTTGQYINLVTAIFSRAAKGVFEGKSGILTGIYRFEFVFLLRLKPEDADADLNVDPVRCVLAGGFGLMGTDDNGRDLWSAIVYGVRWALLLGVVVSTVTIVLGAIYGTISAYFGGKLDMVMQQIARVYVSIPSFPLLILLSWSIGRSLWLLIAFLIIFGWMGGQFTVRSMALQIREQTYIEAARALGASHARIIFRYVFPQVAPYLFASIALGVPGAILTEAGLSYLGLGDPTLVTWGKILYEASGSGGFAGLGGAWWWIVFPGLAITITSLAFIMFGQAIERIIEPRLKTR